MTDEPDSPDDTDDGAPTKPKLPPNRDKIGFGNGFGARVSIVDSDDFTDER